MMRISNKFFTLQELENSFAENFDSPLFPILADFYLNNSQEDKALRVSKIGLKNSPNNFLGQQVLSKIYIINNDFIKAEKLLTNIIKHQPCNMDAILTLIKIKISLKRSKNKITKHIDHAFNIFPYAPEIKSLYDKYCYNKKTKMKTHVTNKKSSKGNTSTIKFDNKLATKSMYQVLINQKKYNEAIEVLHLMSKNKKNKSFVNKEKEKILKKKGIRNAI